MPVDFFLLEILEMSFGCLDWIGCSPRLREHVDKGLEGPVKKVSHLDGKKVILCLQCS